MVVLYNGEHREYDVTQTLNWKQIQDGLENRKNYLGQQQGDFEIVSVDYDWGTRKQVNIAKCVRCGLEKEIPNLRDFVRGKGAARYCKCGREKAKYVPQNEVYRGYVGQTVAGFRLTEYQEGRGFRVECPECGKQKWFSGKAVLSEGLWCNHRVTNDYSDPKYLGMKVGNLTVVGRDGKLFRFRCDCGTEVVRRPSEVFRIEVIKTCGREECPYHRQYQTAGHVKRLAGIKFESECASEMEKQGYPVEMTPETGDFGVDFLAVVDGERVAFQCKRLKVASMISAVQEVYAGGRYYGCGKFVVVSPSGFTERSKIMGDKLGVQLETSLLNFQLAR